MRGAIAPAYLAHRLPNKLPRKREYPMIPVDGNPDKAWGFSV
jgi:hypothetical protein